MSETSTSADDSQATPNESPAVALNPEQKFFFKILLVLLRMIHIFNEIQAKLSQVWRYLSRLLIKTTDNIQALPTDTAAAKKKNLW